MDDYMCIYGARVYKSGWLPLVLNVLPWSRFWMCPNKIPFMEEKKYEWKLPEQDKMENKIATKIAKKKLINDVKEKIRYCIHHIICTE